MRQQLLSFISVRPISISSFSLTCSLKKTTRTICYTRHHQHYRNKTTAIDRSAVSTALFTSISSSSTPQVLIVRRAKAQNFGLWALPGGSVNIGEPLLSAAARELTEETSIPSSLINFLSEHVHIVRIPVQNNTNDTYLIHVFAAVLRSDLNKNDIKLKADSDVSEAKFVTFDQIQDVHDDDDDDDSIKNNPNHRRLECVPNLYHSVKVAYDAISNSYLS